ncbi:MAG: hypothetical protein WAL29_01460 [Bacteroidales bacterium]
MTGKVLFVSARGLFVKNGSIFTKKNGITRTYKVTEKDYIIDF